MVLTSMMSLFQIGKRLVQYQLAMLYLHKGNAHCEQNYCNAVVYVIVVHNNSLTLLISISKQNVYVTKKYTQKIISYKTNKQP